MKRTQIVEVVAVLAVLLAACTSDPLPEITSDSIAPRSEDSDVGGSPEDAVASSLVGTTWVFLESFNVAPAYQPSAITFYRVNGANRIEIVNDCGHAIATFVDTAVGIRINELDPLVESHCWNRSRFFGGELVAEIDSLGRLNLQSSDRIMRFTHVQSTSIHTDEVPERSAGEVLASKIGRSRWIVTEATGAARSDDGLTQTVAFTSVEGDADVVSFFAGCNGSSREIEWTPQARAVAGDVFRFAQVGMDGPPCEDVRQGLAERVLRSELEFDVALVDAATLRLSGDSAAGPWTVVARREDFPSEAPPDCYGFELGSVLDERFRATEILPDGTTSTVILDGFDVIGIDDRLGGDVDRDGEWNPIESFTLRDLQSGTQVDILHVCGLSEPVADFVRIHPNRIVRAESGYEDSTIVLWSSDGERFSQNVHSVTQGPWAVVEGQSFALDDPTYLGRVTLTNQPLSADAGGDTVIGVLNSRSGCIDIIAPIQGALVFPAGRTEWDPVKEEVIVDGVRYADGERISITRLPRPEFLEYYNPMDRSGGCGISTHVVSDIRHIGDD